MPDEPNDPTSPQGEPEPTDETSDAPNAPSDAGGDLSQADIDAALNQASAGDPVPPPETDDTGDTLSQAAIDAAMNQASAGDAAPPPADDDVGGAALSQADIDAAMSDTGDLSQADIDAALAGAAGATAPSEPAAAQAPPADTESSQDDIDALLAAAESLASPDADAAAPEEVLLDSAGRPFDEAAAAMAAAIAEDAAVGPEETAPPSEPATASGPAPTPFELKDFSADTLTDGPHDISILRDVDLKVHIELGRTQMYIEDVLKLTEGSVVQLDNLAGDPVNIYVNDRLVARGEVLVLSDNFCVRISEIMSGPQNVAVA